PGRGVSWSGSTTSPRTVTVELREVVFSGRSRGLATGGMVRGKDAPGWVGTDCCGMFVSLPCSTLGGLRICSTDGAPAAGGMTGAAGAIGRNDDDVPGGQAGSGGE